MVKRSYKNVITSKFQNMNRDNCALRMTCNVYEQVGPSLDGLAQFEHHHMQNCEECTCKMQTKVGKHKPSDYHKLSVSVANWELCLEIYCSSRRKPVYMNKATQPAQEKWKHNASKLSKPSKKVTTKISIIVINGDITIGKNNSPTSFETNPLKPLTAWNNEKFLRMSKHTAQYHTKPTGMNT